MTELTRDEVRAKFVDSGLPAFDRSDKTLNRVSRLRDLINRRMLDVGLMDGTLHMKHLSNASMHDNGCVELRCEAHYFDQREAVTFNQDGFVGFAGWADNGNVQPILRGFLDWMDEELDAMEKAA